MLTQSGAKPGKVGNHCSASGIRRGVKICLWHADAQWRPITVPIGVERGACPPDDNLAIRIGGLGASTPERRDRRVIEAGIYHLSSCLQYSPPLHNSTP